MKNVFLCKAIAFMVCLMCSIGALAQEAYAVFTEADSTLTFFYDELRTTRTGTTYDLDNNHSWLENSDDISRVVFDLSFAAVRPTSTSRWFSDMYELASIDGIAYLNTSSVTNMDRMFQGCNFLESLDLSSFNTEHVTDMINMFFGCASLTSLDLSGFNTRNVTDMGGLFSGCESLQSIDLSGFNTENVTDMWSMFRFCNSLESIDLSGFNTSNVTDMQMMFWNCRSLTSLDLSSFNTKNVTDMGGMFADCVSLTTLDLSGFNTEKVTGMGGMFSGCVSSTSLDLSGFNTKNVKAMNNMFNGCNNLETIYAGSRWCTNAVHESSKMFYGCANLVGGQGTSYDENHVDVAFAHIDGGPSNPGYLTLKVNTLQGDVNGDEEVNIADINAVINIILGGNGDYTKADVNGDHEVNIADVNTIINIILSY